MELLAKLLLVANNREGKNKKKTRRNLIFFKDCANSQKCHQLCSEAQDALA